MNLIKAPPPRARDTGFHHQIRGWGLPRLLSYGAFEALSRDETNLNHLILAPDQEVAGCRLLASLYTFTSSPVLLLLLTSIISPNQANEIRSLIGQANRRCVVIPL